MKFPKASYVIPVYDGAAYLAETIESCLSQTVKNIEIIVVNDGSTDSTRKLIDYYSALDKRVRPIHLEKNMGRSLARNAGIRESKTDFLFMLDADDIALPTRTLITLEYFKKNPLIDIVFGSFIVTDSILNDQGIVDAIPFDIKRVKETGFTFIGHSTMTFRRSVFDKVQYKDGEISQNAIDDWFFQVNSYQAGFKFGCVRKPLVKYRQIKKQRNETRILELKQACLP